MPDDIEEFWEDIRIYPDPDPFAPETLDARQQAVSSAAQRMITDGVDPRLVSRAQSLTDREIIEARDIINTVRGSHSWRSIPTHEARRNFINQLHDELIQRRLLDLHPIAIANNGLIINPGETLIEFEQRCRQVPIPIEDPEQEGIDALALDDPDYAQLPWERATGMEAHERALNRLAALDITESFRTLGLNCQVSLNPVGELRLESQGAITIDGRAITLHPRRR